jgi:hypothetical protein
MLRREAGCQFAHVPGFLTKTTSSVALRHGSHVGKRGQLSRILCQRNTPDGLIIYLVQTDYSVDFRMVRRNTGSLDLMGTSRPP